MQWNDCSKVHPELQTQSNNYNDIPKPIDTTALLNQSDTQVDIQRSLTVKQPRILTTSNASTIECKLSPKECLEVDTQGA